MFKNKRVVSYLGRNGTGKQTGIEILPIGDPSSNQVVTLSPVNSNGNIANCMIDIPVNDIPDVVRQLNKIYKAAANAPAH